MTLDSLTSLAFKTTCASIGSVPHASPQLLSPAMDSTTNIHYGKSHYYYKGMNHHPSKRLIERLNEAVPRVLSALGKFCFQVSIAAIFLLLLSGLTFVLTSLSPGDAALNTLQPMGVTSTQVLEQVRSHLGLDAPILSQYLTWLYMVVIDGNLGLSSHFGREVTLVLIDATYETIKLCMLAAIFLVILTLPTGIYCALRPNRFWDRTLHVICILLLSLPSFLIALLCLYFLGVKTSIVSTLKPQSLNEYITPALCLSLPLCAYYLRQVRMAVQKELQAPYLIALTARGISIHTQIYRHILPRALITLLPLLGISLGHLLCGAVIVESIVSLNGLGAIALQAISYRDLYLIQAYVLYCALIFMVCNYGVNRLTLFLSRHALTEAATC